MNNNLDPFDNLLDTLDNMLAEINPEHNQHNDNPESDFWQSIEFVDLKRVPSNTLNSTDPDKDFTYYDPDDEHCHMIDEEAMMRREAYYD